MRVERIEAPDSCDGTEGLLAIVLFRLPGVRMEPGVNFLTEPDLPQQVACIRHPAGHVIEPHTHNVIPREVRLTQEVLVIQRGTLRIDFFTSSREYVGSRQLQAGDVVILIGGGHGFEVLEDVELIEVKQGPYLGARDKVRFLEEPCKHTSN